MRTQLLEEMGALLAVDCNTLGHREKTFRLAIEEQIQYAFDDWVVEGPAALLFLMNHMLKTGLTPRGWFNTWCREAGIDKSDRVYHELVLVEALERAMTYDQLNCCSLACCEIIGRRIISIIDAYEKSPKKPDFRNNAFLSGAVSSNGIDPQLRAFASR